MRAVLADSGPLYADAIKSEQYHDRARHEHARLATGNTALIVAYPTLLEAYGLILRRTKVPIAHAWLSKLTPGIILFNPSPVDYDEASLRIRRYADQPMTMFDVLLGVVAERLTIPVWTYDHHFDVMRVSVWR